MFGPKPPVPQLVPLHDAPEQPQDSEHGEEDEDSSEDEAEAGEGETDGLPRFQDYSARLQAVIQDIYERAAEGSKTPTRQGTRKHVLITLSTGDFHALFAPSLAEPAGEADVGEPPRKKKKKENNRTLRPTHRELDRLFKGVATGGEFDLASNRAPWYVMWQGSSASFTYMFDFYVTFKEVGVVSYFPITGDGADCQKYARDPGGDEFFYRAHQHRRPEVKFSWRVAEGKADGQQGSLADFCSNTSRFVRNCLCAEH